jgi:hypothetical protein
LSDQTRTQPKKYRPESSIQFCPSTKRTSPSLGLIDHTRQRIPTCRSEKRGEREGCLCLLQVLQHSFFRLPGSPPHGCTRRGSRNPRRFGFYQLPPLSMRASPAPSLSAWRTRPPSVCVGVRDEPTPSYTSSECLSQNGRFDYPVGP